MEIEKFRFPGEFEPQTDVFINWLPDYCAGEDGDKGREVLVEVVKNLLGHVNVHVNCGCETSLEACKQMLADAGVDVSDPDTEGQRNTAADNGDEKFSPFIRFTQFDDWSVSIRDNGPDVMIDDEGNTLAVNMRWSNYSNNDKMEPAQQLARRAGANMAIDLDVFDMVNSDMVSEGGNREFNGKGVMIAVEDTEVVKRNPEYTKEEIEDEYKRVWNLDKIIWIPKPMLEDDDIRKGPIDKMEDGTLIWPGSFAAHADEYCRFVDEDTVLLAEVTEEEAAEGPISAENKRRIDAAYEILTRSRAYDPDNPGRTDEARFVLRDALGRSISSSAAARTTPRSWAGSSSSTRTAAWPSTAPRGLRATTASSTPAATATSSCATTWCWASATGTRAWIRRSRRRTSALRRCSRACSPTARSSCWTPTT